MPSYLDYTVLSVNYSGITIRIDSLYTGYNPGDSIDVTIYDNGPGDNGAGTGQWTGTTTAPLLTGTHLYTWMDLIGQNPNNEPGSPSPGNYTRITIFDAAAESDTGPTAYSTGDGSYFPWPSSGGGGGVACFTASSKLLTPTGYVEASTLRTGDILVTSDGRQIPIKMYTSVYNVDKTTAPYLIPKNSLARNVPVSDLRLSPWHAISIGKGLWQKPQTAAEINPGSVIQYDIGKSVRYYHFEAPNYFKDNFVCEGTIVESFSAKQLSLRERPYTWSKKYKAYTRSTSSIGSKKSTGV